MRRLRGDYGTRARRVRRSWRALAVFVTALVAMMVLAACDGGRGAGAPSTTPTSAGVSTPGSLGSGTAAPALTPTTGAVTTPGAQQGTAEFCTAPANVSAQLPASIPAYPRAQLRLGQSAGGSGIYGLCSGDTVSAVAQFYSAKLPSQGWQQVTTTTNAGVEQVQAEQGSAHVVMTAEPDAQLGGTTDIIILTTGM